LSPCRLSAGKERPGQERPKNNKAVPILHLAERSGADMLAQAEEEGIPVLGTDDQAFETTGKIFNLLSL